MPFKKSVKVCAFLTTIAHTLVRVAQLAQAHCYGSRNLRGRLGAPTESLAMFPEYEQPLPDAKPLTPMT